MHTHEELTIYVKMSIKEITLQYHTDYITKLFKFQNYHSFCDDSQPIVTPFSFVQKIQMHGEIIFYGK